MKYETLREKLKEEKMSIRQLSIKSGIVSQSLYSAMNGKCEFWPGWKKKVSEALGVPEAVLFPEGDENGEG